ncbi:MAG: hypothetical protein PQJ50_04230, partial [Spirochaetales bacterium]|nr:hypothetical protein [Spirochaetales bacterium]
MGDNDGINVVFFEIPDTTTSTLYFGVRDPGANNLLEDENTGTTDFYLIGGSGALSSSNSKLIDYTAAVTVARTGTELAMFTADSSGTFNGANGWYYFPGVQPSQGEHIGNKYYFKIVVDITTTDVADTKNAYQLDVSLSGTNEQDPIEVSGATSFAYNLCFDLKNGGPTWELFPYVPGSALAAEDVIFHNWDFDAPATYTLNVYNRTDHGTPVGSPTASGNNALVSANYTIGAGEMDGTWKYEFDSSDGTIRNASEVWVTHNGNPLRMYSTRILSPAASSYVVTTSVDGEGIADGVDIASTVDREEIRLQVVDASGDPTNQSESIDITLTDDGGNQARIVSVNGVAYGPAASATITTDDYGYGYYEIARPHDGTVDGSVFTVTSTVTWTWGTNTSDTYDVLFYEDPDPTISSASNMSFDVTDGSTVISDITIDHPSISSKIVDIGSGTTDLQIRIPDSLDAEFDPGAMVTLTDPASGTGTGDVNAAVTYSGDSKVLYIDVEVDFLTDEELLISGLQLQNFNAVSQGNLELSWDGGSTFPVSDDKILSITDSTIGYIWVGITDSNWSTATNWAGGVVPSLVTDTVLIQSSDNDPVMDSAVSVAELTILSGATLSMNNWALSVSTTLDVSGTLVGTGASNLTLSGDADFSGGTFTKGTGLIIFDGAGAQSLTSGGQDLGDMQISTAATVLTLNDAGNFDDVTIGNATAELVLAADLSVGGNWTNSGIFTSAGNTVTFDPTAGPVAVVTGGNGGDQDFDALVFDDGGAGVVFTVTGDLTANTSLTVTDTGGITFSGDVSTPALTLTDSSGTIAFTGGADSTALTVAGNAMDISFTGGDYDFTNAVTFSNTGVLTLGNNNGDTLSFTNGVTAVSPSSKNVAGTLDAAGTGVLNLGGITPVNVTDNAVIGGTSTGDITLYNTTIADGVSLTLGAGSGSDIFAATIDGSVNGTSDLTINSAGAVSITGNVGSAIDLGTITIVDSNGTTFGGTVDADNIVITDTATGQTISFTDDTTVNTAMSAAGTANDYNISFTGASNSIAGTTTLANTGTLVVGDADTDSTVFAGGIIAATQSSKNIAGALSTTGTGAINLGVTDVIITADSVIGGASTGAITLFDTEINVGFTLTLGTGAASPVTATTIYGTGAGSSDLIINTTAAVNITGDIGPNIDTIIVTDSGGVIIGGSVTAATVTLTDTTGTIEFQGDVTVTSALT